MAATVTANLTLVAQGESGDAGIWLGNSGGHDTEVFYQNTASYTWQASKSARTSCTYTPTTNINMTGTDNHLYWWAQNAVASFMEDKTTGTTTASGYTIRLTDGSGNYREYHIAGGNTWGGEWRCFVIDLSLSTGDEIYASSGTLDLTDIDVITWYVDISNSGNIRIIDNQWNDVVRFGTGLTATGTDFDLIDIAIDDALLANKYGVLEIIDGQVFCQGKVIVGNGATTTTFNSTDELLVYRDRVGGASGGFGIVSTGLYELVFTGSGCVVDIAGMVIKGAGTTDTTRFAMDASDVTSDVTIDGSTFIRAGLCDFASTSDVQNSVFNNCFQIDPSTGIFKNNSISNYVGLEGGAVLWPTDSTNISDLTFSICDQDIEYDAASDATPSFLNIVHDDNAGDYDVNNTSGSSVTIPLSGTSNGNSYTGSLVEFEASVTLTFTVKDEAGVAIDEARINIVNASTKVELYQIETNSSGIATQSHTYAGDLGIEGWIRQMDISGDDYIPQDFEGTIKSTGFDANIKLIKL